jgi:hypothetical protein
MPLTKSFEYGHTETGKTIYALIKRLKDGAWLDTNKKFRETPTDPFQDFTEKTLAGVATKIYEWSDATEVWNDGGYTIYLYEQDGGAPGIADDLISSSTTYIKNDEQLERNYFYSLV